MTDNSIIEKVIRTTEIGGGGGGLLNAQQANKFIDYMWDATVLGGMVRTQRMVSETMDIDVIGVGTRLMRVATEAVDDGVNAGAAFSKISLTVTKLRLDYEISTEALEDSIEGQDLETHIAQLMGTQAGMDIEDVSINGDTTLSSDPLLKAFNGWRKLGLTNGHVIDNAHLGVDQGVFHKALKALPRKYYQRRGDLRWFSGTNLIQDWLIQAQLVSSVYVRPYDLAARSQAGLTVPSGSAGYSPTPDPLGVPLIEVPLFPVYDVDSGSGGTQNGGDLWLTFPKNLIWGVKREIKIYRQFKPKTDSTQYTMYTRIGTQVENADAFVVCKNVEFTP